MRAAHSPTTLAARIGGTLIAAALTLGGGLFAAAPAQAATPAVKISKIYYDSPGSDRRSNASLNGEYVVLKNTTTKSQTITGWTVRDAASHVYEFPKTSIPAGKTITLRTGKGRNTATTRYWQRGSYVWNNNRDTATLRKATGAEVSVCSYDSTAVDYKKC